MAAAIPWLKDRMTQQFGMIGGFSNPRFRLEKVEARVPDWMVKGVERIARRRHCSVEALVGCALQDLITRDRGERQGVEMV